MVSNSLFLNLKERGIIIKITTTQTHKVEPEMESTNCPLMKSLVNFMVGILKEKSEETLERLAISL